VLVEHSGDLVARDRLTAAAWPETVVEDNNLNMQIAALRRVLDDGRTEPSCIQTVPGRGYRFVARVTRVKAEARAGAAALPPSALLPLPDKPSIAVLPFANLSGDPEQEYFADGMVEEIITALSRIRWLFVITRNSSFTYKGQVIDAKQVGRELGVRYVLEGAVRKAGQRVRVTAQLIDATTGAHLWADHFDGSLEDIFEVQDKVAISVAGVIEPTLQAAEIRTSGRNPAFIRTPDQRPDRRTTSIYAHSRIGAHSRRTASFWRSACSGKRRNAIRITPRRSPWRPIATKGSR
jgi:TolB-like protein